MTDSIKFGPEWLRNLSGDGCTSVNSGGIISLTAPRYQLADHRYGREEMLALFDRNFKPPEALKTFSGLYVDKALLPLALIQMTEDETRMWNGGVSSNISSRGRGGSVDRGGRGRGSRGGSYSSHYTRGVGFDELGDGTRMENPPFMGRIRPYDRSQNERGWSERNGASDSAEWNGSTSPRKDMGRGPSGGSLMESNWRRHRGSGEEDDSWRKWARNNWREMGSMDRDRVDRNEGSNEENRNSGGRWEHRGNHRSSHDSSHHPPPPRSIRTWESNHDNHDKLPEWATANPSETGGSFDATGAFHGGMYSDDDEDGTNPSGSQESRTRRISEGNTPNTKLNNKTCSINSGQSTGNRHVGNRFTLPAKEKSKSPAKQSENDKKPSTNEKEKTNVSPNKPSPAPSVNDGKQATTVPPITTNSTPKDTKESSNVSGDNVKNEKLKKRGDESTIKTQNREKVKSECELVPPNTQTSNKKNAKKLVPNSGQDNLHLRSDDDLDRMKEKADALVAKLMADEGNHKEKPAIVASSITTSPTPVPSTNSQEEWFYRDPQGEVQGPFLPSEMADWCNNGYFTTELILKRSCDERYTSLGELFKLCGGRSPFASGPLAPPIKMMEPIIPPPPVPGMLPAGIAGGSLPKSSIEDPLLLLQYQQMRFIQSQHLLRQMQTNAVAKLSQSERWATLSPEEQMQSILQYVLSDTSEIPMPQNPFVPHLPSQPSSSVLQLFSQLQQTKSPTEPHLPTNPHSTTPVHSGQIDYLQQLIQQMGGIQSVPKVPQQNINPGLASTQKDDPIKSLLRQLHVNANGQPQLAHMDTVWPQPPPHVAPPFNAQNWLAQVGPIPSMPPGQLPNSLWDLHKKEMKTEQQILDEQNLRLQEDRKKEELRKQEELKRQTEEEDVKRKQREEQAKQAEEAKRKDEGRRRKEEEKKRKEEEKRKQEEELKRKEEKKRKEDERKREEKKKQEEEMRKKLEEEKKKKEELRKQEEKQKKEDEKKRKIEEDIRRQEEDRIRRETETRKQVEAEEQARRAEQRRREAEAFRKLQERSKAPWAQGPCTSAPSTHASLAEIQKLEREKKAEEQRIQQILQQQLAQQKQLEAAQEAATDSSKRLQFKWAEKALNSTKPLQVKNLVQIQQEEQERIAKKEKERQEKVGNKETAAMLQNAGIWGTASQCLSWTSSTTSSSGQSTVAAATAWSSINSNASGFWEDPQPIRSSTTVAKQASKPTIAVSKSSPCVPQSQNNKSTKSKNKREEELVKKLFEQNTAKPDDFTQWCTKALSDIEASVDIPTFVGFLRDIESAYEVKEYVRIYLGDTKQVGEFAKQFLEKRSKWRSAQRPKEQADDLCKPAPAINPNAPMEFQEVKGKSKKPKKGKMFKVDSRYLGFSVTAAPDRINVGDRDYGEGV